MITKIAPSAPASIAETKLAEAATKSHAPAEKRDPNLAKVASQFEQVFVRQLLSAAKIGGSSDGGGYGAMAVDALATGVSQAGGLGIAAQIEAALSHSHAAHAAPASSVGSVVAEATPKDTAPNADPK